MTTLTTPALPGFEAWITEGKQIAASIKNSQWRIGDWLNAQDSKEKWPHAQAIFDGMRYELLSQAEKLARFYPPDKRVASLSFSHHKIAWTSGLDQKTAVRELKSAAKNGLSYENFRKQIRKLNEPELVNEGPQLPAPDVHPFATIGTAFKRLWTEHTKEPLTQWTDAKLGSAIEDLENIAIAYQRICEELDRREGEKK